MSSRRSFSLPEEPDSHSQDMQFLLRQAFQHRCRHTTSCSTEGYTGYPYNRRPGADCPIQCGFGQPRFRRKPSHLWHVCRPCWHTWMDTRTEPMTEDLHSFHVVICVDTSPRSSYPIPTRTFTTENFTDLEAHRYRAGSSSVISDDPHLLRVRQDTIFWRTTSCTTPQEEALLPDRARNPQAALSRPMSSLMRLRRHMPRS